MDTTSPLEELQSLQGPQGVLASALTPGAMPGLQAPPDPMAHAENAGKWNNFLTRLQTDHDLQLQMYSFFSGMAKPSPNFVQSLSRGADDAMNTRMALGAARQSQNALSAKTQYEMQKDLQRRQEAEQNFNLRRVGLGLQARGLERQLEDTASTIGHRKFLEDQALATGTRKAEEEDFQQRQQVLKFYTDQLGLSAGIGVPTEEQRNAALAETYAFYGDRPQIKKWLGDAAVRDLYPVGGGKYVTVNQVFTADNGKCYMYLGEGSAREVSPGQCGGSGTGEKKKVGR